jgi:hypothetical protein
MRDWTILRHPAFQMRNLSRQARLLLSTYCAAQCNGETDKMSRGMKLPVQGHARFLSLETDAKKIADGCD